MLILKMHKIEIIALLAILFLGTFFHVHDLGNPGFWGDEETSSMPAKALAQGNGATFPSGMEYRRALPQTYLNALSAKTFGIDNDLSYRIPSSIFGVATLVLIFLLTARFLGLPVAIATTALLAFSEWHIILSRTARMYGPLLFFSISFCFAALAWHQKTKNYWYLILAGILFLTASIFNYLAIIVLPILFIPIVFQRFQIKTFSLSLVSTAALGAISTVYFKTFVTAPYKEIQSSRLLQAAAESDTPGHVNSLLSFFMTDYLLIIAGLVFGAYIFFKLKDRALFKHYPLISLGTLVAAIAIGVFIFYGKVYGVIIATVFILILLSSASEKNAVTILRLLAFTALIATLMILVNVFNHGLTNGLKESFNYPFPYLLYQGMAFPGVIILFAIGVLNAVFSATNKQREIIKVLALVVLLPNFMLGLVLDWAPPRYLVTIYPLLLIVASYGLICLLNRITAIKHSRNLLIIFAALIPASGILGGHGIPQAIAVSPSEYGDYIYSNHISGIKYPDHRSHGCFVKQHLQQGDIVVAEDALQMYWYIGQVDYWLRSPANIDDFLYLDSDGELRDIYVSSKPTTDAVIKKFTDNTENQIWVVTSGETQQHLDSFLEKGSAQRTWLDTLMKTGTPVLKGRDGMSATYCLNCKHTFSNEDPWDYDCQ